MARRPSLELAVEEITPKVAKEMLECNTHNRKVSDRLVQVYAEAMRNDEWKLNGEPIIFDKTGRLQSGQHRLLACIEADVAFWSVVVREAEPSALYTLDTGRKRQLTDALALRGETAVSTLATGVLYRWRYDHNLMAGAPIPPSVSTLLAYLDDHPSLRDSVHAGYKARRHIAISAGMYTALYDVFESIDADNAELFTELLCTGDGLDSSSPIFVCRRWIIRSKLGERRPTVPNYAAIIVKAWNDWREHRVMGPRSAYTWRAEEEFPEAI